MGTLRTDKISGLEIPTKTSLGPELVDNGTFDSDLSGWSVVAGSSPSSSIAHASGGVNLTRGNGSGAGQAVSQQISVIVGQRYYVSIDMVAVVSGTAIPYLFVGTSEGLSDVFVTNGDSNTIGTLSGYFIATTTTVWVAGVLNNYATQRFDNITVRPVNSSLIGSVKFDGDGDYLTIPSTDDLKFKTGDFTVEMWVYHTDLTGQQTYFGDTYGSTAGLYLYKTNTHQISLYDTAQRSVSAEVIKLNTWHHIAWTRRSGTLRAFVDGLVVDSDTYAGDFTINQYYVGDTASTSSGTMFGYISNLRVLKGTALYTEDFTVPKHALEKINDTVLLCCNDPFSHKAEATGKTLNSNGYPVPTPFGPDLTVDFTSGTTITDNAKFDTRGYFVAPSGTGGQVWGGAGRGFFAGGYNPATQSRVQTFNINTTGSAVYWSYLIGSAGGTCTAASTSTRMFAIGGYIAPDATTNIDYTQIASDGARFIDFGDLVQKRRDSATCGNNEKLLVGSGTSSSSTSITLTIDYIIPTSTGVKGSFGNLTSSGRGNVAFSSPTRGVFAGGYKTPAAAAGSVNAIEYVTIATLGDSQDFGDLVIDNSGRKGNMGAFSNSIRGIVGGGSAYTPGLTLYNTIEYITIATTGNAQDFGDMFDGGVGGNYTSGSANQTRGVFVGGAGPAGAVNTIQYITIASSGNALDFGDLADKLYAYNAACSDSHGGIS